MSDHEQHYELEQNGSAVMNEMPMQRDFDNPIYGDKNDNRSLNEMPASNEQRELDNPVYGDDTSEHYYAIPEKSPSDLHEGL